MNRTLLVLAIALLHPFVLASCAAPGTTGDDDVSGGGACSDPDRDGYGTGPGCRGSDCDETNPDVASDAECEALCAVDPHSTGCACDPGSDREPEPCYTGRDGTSGIGPCIGGLRECSIGGEWGGCVGQEVPREESCNEIDDDCDGETDEGVTNSCGTCAGACEEDCVGAGEGCADFSPDEEGENVETCEGDPDCITLGGRNTGLHLIWIANSSEGTVSKIDTETREELARYVTSSYGRNEMASPSRTSVDFRGDVVVANRAFGYMPSVTKILASDCPAGDTSTGGDDVLDWGRDACVAWNHGFIGAPIARAVAVQDRGGLDGAFDEYVWVGLFDQHRYYELDRDDGRETGQVADCSPCTPYGAAVDRDGNLWSACLSTSVCRFDTEDTDDVEVLTAPSPNYGITVDSDGRVWFGGPQTVVYEPDGGGFTLVSGAGGTGIAADGDGSVWQGYCGTGMCRIDTDTLDVTSVAAQSYGVGVDFDGQIWGVPMGAGYVDVVDPGARPGDETIERALNDCDGGFGITGCLVGPYTYSDMTGFQLHNATSPEGRYTHVFEGCPEIGTTTWSGVSFDADTPPGSAIEVSVRTADSLEAMGALPFTIVGTTDEPSPLDLAPALGEGPHGRYLEVRFTLRSEGLARPRLMELGAQRACEAPIE